MKGLDKIRVAEDQLKSAIRLFFKEEDPISVHALASASQEVLESLGKHRGIVSMRQKTIDLVIDNSEKKILISRLNRVKNFLKHANSDHDSRISLNQTHTEEVILDAVLLYFKITKQKIPVFIVYDLWFYAHFKTIRQITPPEEWNSFQQINFEDKNECLNLIASLENKQRQSVKPTDKILSLNNKNFGEKKIEFDSYTKVFIAEYTLNGGESFDPGEKIILNFYLQNVWAKGQVLAKDIGYELLKRNPKVIGIPFTAPDYLNQQAYFVFLYLPFETFGYLHMMKIISLGDSAVSIIYSKKFFAVGDELEKKISFWLSDNLESSVGAAYALGEIGVDNSWLPFLHELKN